MTASRLAGALLGLALLCAGVQPAAAQTVGADAAIDKAGGGSKTVGQSVSFTVTARNAGSLPLPGTLFTVNDTIQAPLTGPVTASGSNWACTVTGLVVSCHYNGGAVLPGASPPPITITAVAGSPGSYNNCARVVLGAVPDSNQGNNQDCAGGVIQPAVSQYDVGIEKAVRGPSVVGQATTFTLSPYNVGPSPVGNANAVQVIDVLPANFTAPITASGPNWTCSVSGQMVTCTYIGPSVGVGGNLPPITITAMTRTPGPWRNCARIGLRGQDVNKTNNEDCASGEAGGGGGDGRRTDVGIRKSGPAVVVSGQPATFTLSPFNVGPSPVDGSSGIRVTDMLPANFVGPVTAFGAGWTCTVSGSGPYLVTCDYFGGSIPANGLLPIITIKATAKEVGGWSNCTDITLKSGKDASEQNNHSCTGGEVRPGKPTDGPYDVGIRKRGPDVYKAGQPATFVLSTINNGPATVSGSSGVYVTDTLQSGLTAPITVNAPPGWTCSVSGLTVTCHYTGGPVTPGQGMGEIKITAIVARAGEINNCAAIDFERLRDVRPEDNRDCVNGPITDKPSGYDIGIDKAGPEKVTVGQAATFTLNTYNTGPSPVTSGMGVKVFDTLPTNFTPPVTVSAPGGWICQTTGLSVVCTWGGPPIPPGAPFPPITVSALATTAGDTQNCASIGLKPTDIKPSDNRDCTGIVIVDKGKGSPDLAIEKTAVDGPWTWPNGHGRYQITVRNIGDVPLPAGHALTIIESIPAGMTFAATPTGWSCSPTPVAQGPVQVTCTHVLTATLMPGSAISLVLDVGFWGERRKSYNNCVELRAYRGKIPWKEVNEEDNHDCAPVEVVADSRYDLSIRKRGPASLTSGQPASFTLTPHNNGPSTIDGNSGAKVTDTLLSGLFAPVTFSVNSSDWSCSVTNGQVACTYVGAPIAAGQDFPSITITATAGKPGEFRNCAEVTLAAGKDTNLGDNKDCVGGPVSKPAAYDVDLTKTAPATVTAGLGINFTLTVSNNGPSPVDAGTVLVVTDTVPPNFSGPMTATGNGWTCVVSAPLVTCTYTGTNTYTTGQTLPPISIGAVATGLGQVDNCALADIDPVDTHPDDNDSCINVEVKPSTPPDLSATKTFSGYGPTGEMNFILTATNRGPGDWSGPITFTDQMPAGLTPLSYFGSGWTCTISGQTFTCTWTGQAIHPGDSFPILDLHVTPSGPGTYHNCATVTTGLPGWQDPTPANNKACADAPYYPAALTLTKSIVDDCYQNGNGADTRCTFRITITNTGGSAWNGPIIFTDMVLPQNASFPSLVGGSPSGWQCPGNQPMICTSVSSVSLGAGASITVDYTVDIGSPIAQHENCASLYAPNATDPSCVTLGGGTPPSLTIEKVVEQDCTGVAPNTLCKFVIRIFNTGSTQFIGQVTFTDLVSLSGMPISGVSLATPHPGGWVCTGIQPLTCQSGIVSIAPGAYVTVPLYMTVNGPVPANQNCATLTLPVTNGPSCATMGSTHVDLGLDSNFIDDPDAPGFYELSYWVESTPQMLPGMQVSVSGSLTPAGYFLPSGTIPPSAVTSAGWTCSGTWASFLCSQTVTTGSFTNGFLVLRLRTSYPTTAIGQTFTYVGAVTTNNNIDPDATNNGRTITAVLN